MGNCNTNPVVHSTNPNLTNPQYLQKVPIWDGSFKLGCSYQCNSRYFISTTYSGLGTINRWYFYLSQDTAEKTCTYNCFRLSKPDTSLGSANEPQVGLGDPYYDYIRELNIYKALNTNENDIFRCLPYWHCPKYFTEGSEMYLNSFMAYKCVDKCIDASYYTYLYKNTNLNGSVVEYCVYECPQTSTQTPVRSYFFVNSRGDKECTS
jgi:hypothetical protein